MIKKNGTLLSCLALLLTSSCSSMKISDFAGVEPRLKMEEYFAGKTRAWGIVLSRSGKLKREFYVDMVGTWDGAMLTLEEDFVFRDGEKTHRTWKIEKLDEHRYRGTADDVIGIAEGASYGNALNWHYDLALNASGRTWKISFDDWMYLQDGDVLINRAVMSKWGFKVGEILLFFTKAN